MAEVTRTAAGIEFDLRTEPPLQQFQFQMRGFAQGISDWTEPLSACGKLFQRQMALQFETEGRSSGKAWAPNEPVYAEWKRSVGAHSHKVGVLYGFLRSSMTGGAGYSEHVTKDYADFGMSENSLASPYGKQFAEKRPVIRMTAQHGGEYQKLIAAWLGYEKNKAAGGKVKLGEDVRLGGLNLRGGRTDWSQR